MPTTRIIFGCGYLGARVGKLWHAAGDRTWAASRDADRLRELAAAGMLSAKGDVTNPASLGKLRSLLKDSLPPVEAMLYAVGFDRTSGVDIHDVYAGGLQNVLAALPPTVSRAIYISTTGVYGSADGNWVDERTPPDPQRDGGRASLAAEQVLTAHEVGRGSAILRLAGLYGPGRVPHLDKLRAGEPLAVPCEGWLNLIHVDDAARIVVAVDQWLASRTTADGPHVFCVSDGSPVVRKDYYAEAARLAGAPPPRFMAPPRHSAALARAAVNRRVSNLKLRETLRIDLLYPSYREGLAAILGPQCC